MLVLLFILVCFSCKAFAEGPSSLPTFLPSSLPSSSPTLLPTSLPSSLPTSLPTSLPSNIPTQIPTCSVDVYDNFDYYDSSIWNELCSFCVYSSLSTLSTTENSLMRTSRSFTDLKMISAGYIRDASCNNHMIAISIDDVFTFSFESYSTIDAVVFFYDCEYKYLVGLSHGVSKSCPQYGNLTMELTFTDNMIEFYDDSCGTLSLSETFFASNENYYVYIGGGAVGGELSDEAQWNWISIDVESGCDSISNSSNITYATDDITEVTCTNAFDDFSSFDSEIWDTQCSGCQYGNGSLAITGGSMLQRSASSIYNLSTIYAGFTKDKECDDHLIVVSAESDLAWSWESTVGSIKFGWNCDIKVIYGQTSDSSESSCAYGSGDYVVEIKIDTHTVSFSDDLCGTLTHADSLGSSFDSLYVYFGADSDVVAADDSVYYYYADDDYTEGEDGKRRQLQKSDGVADWLWITYASGCFESLLDEHDGSNGTCSSDLNYMIENVVSSTACWYACVDMFGDASVVAADYWHSDGSCYCQDSCDCVGFDAHEGTSDGSLIVASGYEIPSACTPSSAPTSVPTCSVGVYDNFTNFNSEIWDSVCDACYYDLDNSKLVVYTGISNLQRTSHRFNELYKMSAFLSKTETCNTHMFVVSTDISYTFNFQLTDNAVGGFWSCDEKQVFTPNAARYIDCAVIRDYLIEITFTENSIEFWDDGCGDLLISDTFFASNPSVYVYIGAGANSFDESSSNWDWLSLEMSSNSCGGDDSDSANITYATDDITEVTCTNAFDDFSSFDSEIWDTQCSGCQYGNGSLAITGGSMLQRSASSIYNLSTIYAGFTKDKECDDHLIVVSAESDLAWSWESTVGSIKFGWNCDIKVIYGQTSDSSESSCAYGSGDYVVEIKIDTHTVSFSDDLCGTLTHADSLGSSFDSLYVYFGADNDVVGDGGYYYVESDDDEETIPKRRLSATYSGGSADWLWITYASGCFESLLDERDGTNGTCSSDLNYMIENVVSSTACWYACVDMFGDASIVAADYWHSDESCYCQDSCECLQSTSDDVILVVETGYDVPSACTGIVINATNTNATYDNFGDSLQVASYTISLLSKPINVVMVNFTGLSEYSMISPSSLIIQPHHWYLPININISCHAPTYSRPICSNGNRYCDTFSPSSSSSFIKRKEIILPLFTSLDLNYNHIERKQENYNNNHSMVVHVNIVYDLYDPPKIQTCRFNNLLNGIVLIFDKNTNRAGEIGQFNCSNILNYTSYTELLFLYGEDHTCSFIDDITLQIIFGKYPTLLPGALIKINDYVLKTSDKTASLYTMNDSFILQQPLNPIQPITTLSMSSSSYIGICDDLKMDATLSSGSGGRLLKYNFTISQKSNSSSNNLDPSDIQNVSNILKEYTNKFNNEGYVGNYLILIPSNQMVIGVEMVISLTVTNFLGIISEVSEVKVMKLNIPVPNLSIQGTHPRYTTNSETLNLQASASLPTMTCLNYNLINTKMEFLWYEDTGQYLGDDDVGDSLAPFSDSYTSKDLKTLVLPANSLTPLISYKFRVVAMMSDMPYINNSATVDVEVTQQDIVALISGGSYREIGYASSFKLHAGNSYDPDNSNTVLSFLWSCSNDNCLSLDEGIRYNETLSIPSQSLAIGHYNFKVFVYDLSNVNRNHTSSIEIQIVDGSPPIITLTALTLDKYSVDSNYLGLSASISTSASSYTTVWTSEYGDIDNLFTIKGVNYNHIDNNLEAAVNLALLTYGSTYMFKLTATDNDATSNNIASSSVSLIVNEPPSSGSFEVTPKKGYTLNTFFTFITYLWCDEDLPLSYIFGTTTQTNGRKSPFGDERYDSSQSNIILSQGDNATNHTVGCYVQVKDYYGAVTTDTTSVYVGTQIININQLRNISNTMTLDAINSKNGDISKQVIYASTQALKSLTMTSNPQEVTRRSLLSEDDDDADDSALLLRSSLLSNLWATYQITSISISNVASLLNVLVSIIDTPSEMNTEMANSAMYFVKSVLEQTYYNEIGISTVSSEYVGEALSYLLNTFNTSDISPYMASLQNLTRSIDIISAAQLMNASDGVGYGMNAGDINMYSYRTTVSSMITDASYYLSTGGSSDLYTSIYMNINIDDLNNATNSYDDDAGSGDDYYEEGEGSDSSSDSEVFLSDDLMDLKFYTIPSTLVHFYVKGTSGSLASIVSRLDQTSNTNTNNDDDVDVVDQTSGVILIRSKVLFVQLSGGYSQGSYDVYNLPSKSIDITMKTTYPFNTSYHKFVKSYGCPIDGVTIDMNCPFTSDTHRCDHATYGVGGAYDFEYTCPYVVPRCLHWSNTLSTFDDTECEVVSGYTADAVTCRCSRLGVFMLSGNVTQSKFEAFLTPAPTLVPSASHEPSLRPSIAQDAPTPLPTPCVDTSPYCAHVTEFCETSFCPSCPQAGHCDVTCHIASCSRPTSLPSLHPTSSPSFLPTYAPSAAPSIGPTSLPTLIPYARPTFSPLFNPTPIPTLKPSSLPTSHPTSQPTHIPIQIPTAVPSSSPSHSPTLVPTSLPTPVCLNGTDPALYLLSMFDVESDGWNGARIVINSSSLVTIVSDTLDSGSTSHHQWICMTTDCYTITIATIDEDISWTLKDQDSIIISGGASTNVQFCTVNGTFENTPTMLPTSSPMPSQVPIPLPTLVPIPSPTSIPIPSPTSVPSFPPTSSPSPHPVLNPTSLPTNKPSSSPTNSPTLVPTQHCIDGQYMDGNSCIDCAIGKYSTIDDDDDDSSILFPRECTTCPSGTFASSTGQSVCETCAVGKTSTSDRSTCEECSIGKFVNLTLGLCVSCPGGFYAPVALDGSCLPCDAGSATGVDSEASSCSPCSPGYYSKGDGLINTCTSCPSGTYSLTRASECIECNVGEYTSSNTSSSCIGCDAGTYTMNLKGSTTCTDCPIGQYSNTRAANCSQCESGKYSDIIGLPNCIACSAGKYTSSVSSTYCHRCSSGTFQGATGQPSCEDCEVGKFAENEASSYCDTCEEGYTSVEASAVCNRCDEAYYWGIDPTKEDDDSTLNISSSFACLTCPTGATCAGGLFQPVPDIGYWMDRSAAANDPSLVQYIYKCNRATCNDVSIDNSNAQRRRLSELDHERDEPFASRRLSLADCFLLANFSSDACPDSVVCTAGSIGPLCGACKVGWTFNASKRRCTLCSESATWLQAFGLLFGTVFIGGLLWNMRSGYLYIPLVFRAFTGGKSELKVPLMGMLCSIDSGALKVLFSTFQIVMSVTWNLNVTFPEPYKKFTELMSWVQLDFFSLECLRGSYYFGVYVSSAFPMVVVALLWIVYAVRHSFEVAAGYGDDITEKLFNEHMHMFLLVVYVFLPPVAAIQFRALNCVVFEDGQSYLIADTSVDCNSKGFHEFAIIDGFLIALYQFLPLCYIALLCSVRDRLNPPHATRSPMLALKRRDQDKSLDALRFLFQDYKCSRWYFEVVDLYRRMFFGGVLPLLSRDNAIVAYIGCFCGLISTIYYRELSPFRILFTNYIGVVAQYVILLVYLTALMIETSSLESLNISNFTVGIILLFINLFIIGAVVWGGYLSYVQAGHVVHHTHGRDVKIEWAAHFSENKFQTTFRFVSERNVPHSHLLVYYYSSLAEVRAVIRHGGIPATSLDPTLMINDADSLYLAATQNNTTENNNKPTTINPNNTSNSHHFGARGGIVVSMKGPHEIHDNDPSLHLMNTLSPSREAVLCLVLPHSLLWRLKPKHFVHPQNLQNNKDFVSAENENDSTLLNDRKKITPISHDSHPDSDHLRIVPLELLEAMAKLYVPSSIANKFNLKSRKQKGLNQSLKSGATTATGGGDGGGSSSEQKRHKSKFLQLPSKTIVRAYQLKEDSDIIERQLLASELISQRESTNQRKENINNRRTLLSSTNPTSLNVKDKNNDLIKIPITKGTKKKDDNDDADALLLIDEEIGDITEEDRSVAVELRTIEDDTNEKRGRDDGKDVGKRTYRDSFEVLFQNAPPPASATSYNNKTVSLYRPTDIKDYANKMRTVRHACQNVGLVPLYHYTTSDVVDSILSLGLRMSTSGQGDGGVYFSTKGPASYGIGTKEYETNMISDVFGEESLHHYREKGKLDVLIVYGADPCSIERAPDSKDSLRMIGRHRFEDFSLPAKDGHYYLRSDRIQAAFVIGLSRMEIDFRSQKKNNYMDNNNTDNSKNNNYFVRNGGGSSSIGIGGGRFILKNKSESELLYQEARQDSRVMLLLTMAEEDTLANSSSVGVREGFITSVSHLTSALSPHSPPTMKRLESLNKLNSFNEILLNNDNDDDDDGDNDQKLNSNLVHDDHDKNVSNRDVKRKVSYKEEENEKEDIMDNSEVAKKIFIRHLDSLNEDSSTNNGEGARLDLDTSSSTSTQSDLLPYSVPKSPLHRKQHLNKQNLGGGVGDISRGRVDAFEYVECDESLSDSVMAAARTDPGSPIVVVSNQTTAKTKTTRSKNSANHMNNEMKNDIEDIEDSEIGFDDTQEIDSFEDLDVTEEIEPTVRVGRLSNTKQMILPSPSTTTPNTTSRNGSGSALLKSDKSSSSSSSIPKNGNKQGNRYNHQKKKNGELPPSSSASSPKRSLVVKHPSGKPDLKKRSPNVIRTSSSSSSPPPPSPPTATSSSFQKKNKN